MYYVWEAKRFSEIAPGVGEDTHFRVMTTQGVSDVSVEGFAHLDKQHTRYGIKRFPRKRDTGAGTMEGRFLSDPAAL